MVMLFISLLENRTVLKNGQFVIVYSVTRLLFFFKYLIVSILWCTMGQYQSLGQYPGRGTLGQSGSFLQHDYYNFNISLADGIVVTSPLEIK